MKKFNEFYAIKKTHTKDYIDKEPSNYYNIYNTKSESNYIVGNNKDKYNPSKA